MTRMGVIEPAQTVRKSPIVFDTRKDGGLRLCVEHININDLTGKDAYAITRMDEWID